MRPTAARRLALKTPSKDVGVVAGELPPIGRGAQVLRQRIVAQLQRLHPLVVLLCGQVMEDQNLVKQR